MGWIIFYNLALTVSRFFYLILYLIYFDCLLWKLFGKTNFFKLLIIFLFHQNVKRSRSFLIRYHGFSGLHTLFDQFLDSVQIVLGHSKFLVIFAKVLLSTPFFKKSLYEVFYCIKIVAILEIFIANFFCEKLISMLIYSFSFMSVILHFFLAANVRVDSVKGRDCFLEVFMVICVIISSSQKSLKYLCKLLLSQR